MEVRDLSPEDLRSYRLNAAALATAAQDWPRAEKVIAGNIERMRAGGRAAPAYLDLCEGLLRTGPEAMRRAFLALTPEAQALRSVHPFAGLLRPEARNRILRETARRPSHEAV